MRVIERILYFIVTYAAPYYLFIRKFFGIERHVKNFIEVDVYRFIYGAYDAKKKGGYDFVNKKKPFASCS